MTALAARVLHAIKTRALVRRGDRIVVAVSGGADSVALLHLLLEIAPSLQASVVGVAHLNHRLRGEAADADQEFVAALARDLSLAFYAASEDVGAVARERRMSTEQAGHAVRRAFYGSAIAALGASSLATGHTADDQAETVLLRLLRGAGPKGLGGIHPRHGAVIRPLLETSRADVRRYLERRGLPWREDSTNDDTSLTRNRVRQELLPLLQSRFSPAIVRTLGRTADVLRDEHAYLEHAATAAASSVVIEEGEGVTLDCAELASLHPALARRIVMEAIRAVGVTTMTGARHVDQVLRLARGDEPPARIQLPGVQATRRGGRLRLRACHTGPPRARPERVAATAPVALAVPGDTDLPWFGLRMEARWIPAAGVETSDRAVQAPDMVVLDASAATAGLFVRSRRPGDRVQPAGRPGRKKLQDLFVDRKVPRHERDRVPVVVDGRGAVVWVVGHAVADPAVARKQGTSVLLLKVKRRGG